MLARLNKPQRLKAGWYIALAYLCCVLAPSMSFAFADGSRSAPCIIEDHGPGMHVHESGHDVQVHDLQVQDSAPVPAHTHGPLMVHDHATSQKDGAVPAKSPQKNADTRCCGLISVSAIAAGETVLVKPAVVSSPCETERYRTVADNTPPGLYRPPIT
jgi:hypothetical protein